MSCIAIFVKILYVVFKLPIALMGLAGTTVLELVGSRSAKEARALCKTETTIGSHALKFGEVPTGTIMTPRVRLEALPVTSSLAEIQDWARDSIHRRLLIYQNSLDRIIGIIHIGDIFKTSEQEHGEFSIRTLIRPVRIVPQDVKTDTLLEELRFTQHQLVVVADNYGATVGIVTLADVVSALVRRFFEEEGSSPRQINSVPGYSRSNASVVLDGLTQIEEVGTLLGLRFQRSEAIRTLGGLVFRLMDRIPECGDTVKIGAYLLQVDTMDGRRVASVRVSETPSNSHQDMAGSGTRRVSGLAMSENTGIGECRNGFSRLMAIDSLRRILNPVRFFLLL